MNRDFRLPNVGGSTIATALTVRLMEELRSGDFAAATRLPAEVELAGRYGVSRSVIRDVLGNLEREGYVERGRGVGTVINRAVVKLNNRLDLKFEYNELIRGSGAAPTTDSVRTCTAAADEELADKLGLDVGAPLVVCEKRMLAGNRPVIFSIDHLPAALLDGVDWPALDWSRPVFDLLWETCGVQVDTSITGLSAVNGPASVRERLALAEGDAMVLLEEVGFFKMGRPILHTYGFYSNYFQFTMLRKKF